MLCYYAAVKKVHCHHLNQVVDVIKVEVFMQLHAASLDRRTGKRNQHPNNKPEIFVKNRHQQDGNHRRHIVVDHVSKIVAARNDVNINTELKDRDTEKNIFPGVRHVHAKRRKQHEQNRETDCVQCDFPYGFRRRNAQIADESVIRPSGCCGNGKHEKRDGPNWVVSNQECAEENAFGGQKIIGDCCGGLSH